MWPSWIVRVWVQVMCTGNGKFSWMKFLLSKLAICCIHICVYIKQSCTINYVVESVKAFSSFTHSSISKYIHTLIIRKYFWCQGVSLLHRFRYVHMCIYIYISKHSMFMLYQYALHDVFWSSGKVGQLYQSLPVSQCLFIIIMPG